MNRLERLEAVIEWAEGDLASLDYQLEALDDDNLLPNADTVQQCIITIRDALDLAARTLHE